MVTQNASAMNFTNSAVQLSRKFCERFQDAEFFTANFVSTLVFIILNVISCPAIIVMNVLVITVIKKRRRLQTMYNILLACLAITDLIVGTVTQPTFITAEIFVISNGSVATYCTIKDITPVLFNITILVSLLHLVLISGERYMAMKYALRYHDIVTKHRLVTAVVLSWLLVGFVSLIRELKFILPYLVIFSLLIIMYCHVTVYFITRRHQKQIKTEQISGEAAAKFLEEKKAWKTTGIIIGFLFLSFLPGLIYMLVRNRFGNHIRNIINNLFLFSVLLNSLCNPIIYCWRSKKIRKAIIALVKGQNQN